MQHMKSWATIDRKTFVVISDQTLELFDKNRQHNLKQPEAGGVLLGRRRGQHLEVVHATQPYPTDIRKRTKFVRESAGHAEEALAMWMASDGEIGYLGEWHSHPEPDPSPSAVDLREWEKLGTHTFANSTMLTIIVGTSNLSLMLYTQTHTPLKLLRIVD